MKIGLAAGVATLFVLGSATSGFAASAHRDCREVLDGAPTSPFTSRYDTGQVLLEKQRGSSVCDGVEGGLYCVLTDPGRFSVKTKGGAKIFAAPWLAKVRLKVRGDEISCRVL